MSAVSFAVIFMLINNVLAMSPNIVLIIADDLGWNDIGFHGSNQIPTPNIDALAYNGMILNHHYTMPTCTPSRAALLTGKYSIKNGMQGKPLYGGTPAGLPVTEMILPQYLKKIGYVTRLIGKWHLGYCKTEYIPTKRGFDSFFGYYNGYVRYNDSVHVGQQSDTWGIDARDNENRAGHLFRNRYLTDVFTEEAVNTIRKHNISQPLYLQVAHGAVHASTGGSLTVRNNTENDEKFGYIKDPQRRLFAGVLSALDDSVGQIIAALDSKEILQNTVILFISDNGGATTNLSDYNTGSNWPLRGMKSSLFEGGVRCPAALWSPFTPQNKVLNGIMHLTDWVPTLYSIAGGDISDLGNIDGFNQWNYLTGRRKSSARKYALLNIDEVEKTEAIIVKNWKYILTGKSTGKHLFSYTGINGRDADLQYNITLPIQSIVNQVFSRFSKINLYQSIEKTFWSIRQQATIDESCRLRINTVDGDNDNITEEDFCQSGCLFNIKEDPCEFVDLRKNNSDVINYVFTMLDKYRNELMPQIVPFNDPRANPIYWGRYWTSWLSEEPKFIETGWFLVNFVACSFLLIHQNYSSSKRKVSFCTWDKWVKLRWRE